MTDRPHALTRKRRRFNPTLLLVVPAFFSILLFCIYPMLKYLPAVVMNWRPPQQLSDAGFVGLKWFKEILAYPLLPQMVKNSIILGLWDIALLPAPLLLALAVHHCESPWMKRAVDLFSLIPAFIPSVVVVAITQRILSTEGLLNQFLGLFGIEGENWLLNGGLFYAYFSLSGLWTSMGFPLLTYRACLSASSHEQHAAAQIEGASLFKRLMLLDAPLCLSTFLFNFVMKVAGILNTSVERLILFNNSSISRYVTTLDLYAYELSFKSSFMPSYSKGMALSLATAVINIALMVIARRVTSRKEDIYA